MRLITIETRFDLQVNGKLNEVEKKLKEKLVGDNCFEIETIFGDRKVLYNGIFDSNTFVFMRSNETTRIIMYPICNIKLSDVEKNTTTIKVKCALPIYWVIFLYFIYVGSIAIFLFCPDKLFSIDILKLISGLVLLNAIILGIHFNELKHYKSILNKLVMS